MLTTLISFVLAVAPAHADDGAGTPPVPLRRWDPSYPDLGILPDIAELRCEVEALVDEQGRVADVQALDCFPNLFPDTDRALRKWTFQPAVRDGVPVPGHYVVAFNYVMRGDERHIVPREEFDRLVAMHQVVEASGEGCTMAMVLLPDGRLSGLESSDPPACMVIPTGWVRPSTGISVDGKQVGCRVTFEALDGVAQDIQVQECFSGLEQSTRKVLKRWVWNSYGGQARPYDLTVWYHPEPGGR